VSNTNLLLVDVIALEESLHCPAVRRSRETVDKLLAEEFVEIGASGRVFHRAEIIELLAEEGNDDGSSITADDYTLTTLSTQIVLLTYRSRETGSDGSVRRVLRSSIWTCESAMWRLRFHQGTIAA